MEINRGGATFFYIKVSKKSSKQEKKFGYMNKNLKNEHTQGEKMYLTNVGMDGIIPPTQNCGIDFCEAILWICR